MKKMAKWAGIGFVAILGLGIVGSLFGDPAPASPKALPTRTALPTWTPTAQSSAPGDAPTVTPAQPVMVPALTDTPVPAATATVEAVPVPTETPLPPVIVLPTVNSAANLRSGPGTGYAVVGSASSGQVIDVVGRTGDNQWYQMADGGWIYAGLVDGVAAETAVVTDIPALPVQAAPAPLLSQPATAVPVIIPTSPPAQAFSCAGGCVQPPDSSCSIKGNVNKDTGEWIYHVPGGQYYSRTNIKPEEGDRWFCTRAEAEAAGFRASER